MQASRIDNNERSADTALAARERVMRRVGLRQSADPELVEYHAAAVLAMGGNPVLRDVTLLAVDENEQVRVLRDRASEVGPSRHVTLILGDPPDGKRDTERLGQSRELMAHGKIDVVVASAVYVPQVLNNDELDAQSVPCRSR